MCEGIWQKIFLCGSHFFQLACCGPPRDTGSCGGIPILNKSIFCEKCLISIIFAWNKRHRKRVMFCAITEREKNPIINTYMVAGPSAVRYRLWFFDKLFYPTNILGNFQLRIKYYGHIKCTTRWFKYDRDKLRLVYTQSVPVIFEPPCIITLLF